MTWYLENKYARWYFRIIENAAKNPRNGRVENHHIHPKSLGGSLESSNTVDLTCREHFICHLLLTKMVEGRAKYKMLLPLTLMSDGNRYKPRSSKIYELARSRMELPSDVRAKISAALKGFPDRMTDAEQLAWKESCKRAQTGKKLSAETKAKMSESRLGVPRSEETKLKCKLNNIGKKRSEETKLRCSSAHLETWTVRDPAGSILVIKNLQDFCINKNLVYSSLIRTFRTGKPLTRGESKGWMVLYKEKL